MKGPRITIHIYLVTKFQEARGRVSLAPRWSAHILLELLENGSNNHVAKEDVHHHKYKELSCGMPLNHG